MRQRGAQHKRSPGSRFFARIASPTVRMLAFTSRVWRHQGSLGVTDRPAHDPGNQEKGACETAAASARCRPVSRPLSMESSDVTAISTGSYDQG